MNTWTGLLFLHGHIVDARVADPDFDQRAYGQTYGNRVANDRVLRETWERAPGGREDDISDTPKAA